LDRPKTVERDGSGAGLRKGGGGPNPNRSSPADVFGIVGSPGSRNIVYVVERSAATSAIADFIRNELAKAVNKLNSTIKFNIIWFAGGEPDAFVPTMLQATEDNKQRFFRHLQGVHFSGSADPAPAILKALALRPDQVYVLSSVDIAADSVPVIAARNTHKARIDVAGFVFPGGKGHDRIRKAAEQNGGRFKPVDTEKLSGR
jgi:hypothetical protein